MRPDYLTEAVACPPGMKTNRDKTRCLPEDMTEHLIHQILRGADAGRLVDELVTGSIATVDTPIGSSIVPPFPQPRRGDRATCPEGTRFDKTMGVCLPGEEEQREARFG